MNQATLWSAETTSSAFIVEQVKKINYRSSKFSKIWDKINIQPVPIPKL